MRRYAQALPPREANAVRLWFNSFYPFQLDWLLEPADLAIANKGRQIGASHTTAGVAVLWGAFHGELTTVISIGQEESDEVLDKCRRHVVLLQKLGSKMARTRRSNTSEIVFESGGRILALPSSGGRGFTGNVFLDEYAYQPDARKTWDAAAPVTMLGYKMRVSSTPNGVGNEFHGLWKRAQTAGARWVPYTIPLSMAQSQGYPVDLARCWELAKGDQRIFAQMFGCSFLDNELQYIPTALLDACSDEAVYCPEDGVAYAGLDIGRSADLTVLCIVRVDEHKVAHVIHVDVRKRTSHEDLEQLAALAFGPTFRCKRLCVDSTGLGAFPSDQLRKKFGRTRVEAVPFTLKSKEDLATTLYQRFVDERVRLPKSDTALREDICALRRIITSAGNVRYDAPHTDAGHADRAWALALALHGCSGPDRQRHEVHDHVESPIGWT